MTLSTSTGGGGRVLGVAVAAALLAAPIPTRGQEESIEYSDYRTDEILVEDDARTALSVPASGP